MHDLVLGIDEAGKGCVIGPLFLGGFLISEEDHLIDKLNDLGVTDSKLLVAKKREEIAKEIKKIAHGYKVIKISPADIDKYSINDLEIKFSAKLINHFLPHRVYLDAPVSGTGIKNYCKNISSLCLNQDHKIIGANKMDSSNIAVAAASILAKSEREKYVKILKKTYGDFGSGYPSDPVTIKWLKDWQKSHAEWPNIVRKKWATLENI
ncbi:MAG: ribonuclease HII [bacterium]|nr:ribonuclease HII [bacterium]